MANFSRLLVLIAVLLMPFGMQPAAAASVNHHPAMHMQHCPDQTRGHERKGALGECTMACSAALPAVDRSTAFPLLIAFEPTERATAVILHGLHPETATPPPRLA